MLGTPFDTSFGTCCESSSADEVIIVDIGKEKAFAPKAREALE